MKLFGKSLVASLAFVGVTGCVTRGQNFSSDLHWLKAKQTTKAEVSQRLGEPVQVGNSGGQETWTYGLYHYRLIGDSQTKEVKIYWLPDGKVDTYTFNSSFPEDKRILTAPPPGPRS